MHTGTEHFSHKFTEMNLIVDNVKLTFLSWRPETAESEPDTKAEILIHSHFYFELFYALHDFSILVADRELRIKKGEIIVVAPNTYHTARYDGSTFGWGVPFTIKPYKSNTDTGLYNDLLEVFSRDGYSQYDADKKTTGIIEDLIAYGKTNSPEKRHLMTAKFYELIFTLKERSACSAGGNAFAANPANQPDIDIEASISQFIKDPDISLDRIAESVNMSAAQINRIIKKKSGLTFRQYVITLRMLNATHLLKESSLSAAQIAEQVGYGSVHGFYSAFRKTYHCTPEEYRSNTEQVCLPASTGNLIRSAASAAQD